MIQFNLDSFPSVVLLSKGETLTKDHLTEGEYLNLENFKKLLQTVDGSLDIDPCELIKVAFDSRGSVTAVYGAVIGLNEEKNGFLLYSNKEQYPLSFTEGSGVLFGEKKVVPLIGREIEVLNSEKERVKIIQCHGMIDNFQFPFSLNKDNPFTSNDQVLFLSGFMSGDKTCYESFINYADIPNTGGDRTKPHEIEPGVYLVTGSNERKDKFGMAYELDLKNLKDKKEVKTWNCSYFKSKFPIYNVAAIRKQQPLYLIVEKPTKVNGKDSFNGSFTLDPQPYLKKLKAS